MQEFDPWRRKWQPTPVFLPGKSHREEPGGLQSMSAKELDSRASLVAQSIKSWTRLSNWTAITLQYIDFDSMASEWCRIQEISLGWLGFFSAWGCFHFLSPNFIILVQFYQNFMSQTYVTIGIEQAEKTLKSTELQSGSQQQLTSHCAGDKSQTHRAATTETTEVGERHNLQVVTAPCHCKVPKIHLIQRSVLFFLLHFGGRLWSEMSQFEHSSIRGFPKLANHLTHLESSVCTLPTKTLIW